LGFSLDRVRQPVPVEIQSHMQNETKTLDLFNNRNIRGNNNWKRRDTLSQSYNDYYQIKRTKRPPKISSELEYATLSSFKSDLILPAHISIMPASIKKSGPYYITYGKF
jgi:hypothetical protein